MEATIPLLALLFGGGLFILLSVRRGATLTAREVLINYLDARRRGRAEEAYRCLAATTRAGCGLEGYKEANSLGSGLVAELVGRHVSFTVERIEENPDRVVARVAVTAPDFPLMLGDICRALDPARFPEDPLAAQTFLCRRISAFLDAYRREGPPLRTTTADYLLQLEANGWKIAATPPSDAVALPRRPAETQGVAHDGDGA
ncbi:MAG: hypothetical protein QM278_06735 [Pseudomonadota bacterium]|nr:hypothetical protein [Pseudomonadota bacterium]